jgi:uncharacterized protein YhaN
MAPAWARRLRSITDRTVSAARIATGPEVRRVGDQVQDIRSALEQIHSSLAALERRTISIEIEQHALRQQVDEAVDYLRVQHFAVREALDRRDHSDDESSGR